MTEEELDQLRKEILPKLARTVFLQSVGLIVLTVVCASVVTLAVTRRPQILGVTDSGSVIPLVALDQAHVNDSRVVSFSAECLQAMFSHDFVNYRSTMNQASKCFTSEGAKSLYAALDPLLDDLSKRRLVMSSVVQPPTVVKKGVEGGVHKWAVQTKMTLYREGTSEREQPRTLIVDLVVERVSLDESVRGVGLSKLNVRPGGV